MGYNQSMTAMEPKHPQIVAIGMQIRKLRQETGVPQEEFARLAGLDRAYYGGIERGERNVSMLNLIKIAAALGAEVGDLFPPIESLVQMQAQTAQPMTARRSTGYVPDSHAARSSRKPK